MTMTLGRVRDWLLARAQDGQMQRSVYVSDYQLREMADAITAHLAQPAQSVDVEKVREVIADIEGSVLSDEFTAPNRWADKLTAALQEKGK